MRSVPTAPGGPERVRNFPVMAAGVNRIEPCPRRIRGFLGGEVVFDTVRAAYVWEWPGYPQYYVPIEDVRRHLVVDEGTSLALPAGTAREHALVMGDVRRQGAARVHTGDLHAVLTGMVRFEWAALDSWFEEDEEVFVHPRNPYARVHAVRSQRRVRVELDGVVLADSRSPVMLFETGLPTRYYVSRTDVRFEHLTPTDSQTSCPYKGITTGYWSVGGCDVAWSYDFPAVAVSAVAGMVAFYNEKVDILLDGDLLPRPEALPQRPPVSRVPALPANDDQGA